MNSKELINAAFNGSSPERCPVTVPYVFLYQQDHFAELTGKPQWQVYQWLIAEPDEHVKDLKIMTEKMSFDIVQPMHDIPSRQERENTEIIQKDGNVFSHKIKQDTWEKISTDSSGCVHNYAANETQHVFDKKDIDEHVKIVSAQQRIKAGRNDYIDAAVKTFGDDFFILSGGVTQAKSPVFHTHVTIMSD